MKKTIFSLLIFFSLFLVVHKTNSAQEIVETESDGLLFEVSGNDLEKPSYVFGTVHIVCPIDMISMESLSGYMAKTDQLILEIDVSDQNVITKVQQDSFLPKGVTLRKLLKPVQYALIDKYFVENIGVSLKEFDQYKPEILSYIVISSPKMIGCTNTTSYEETLISFANRNKKSIYSLETPEFQLGLSRLFTHEEHADQFYKLIADIDNSAKITRDMQIAYKNQSSEKLYELVVSQLSDYKQYQTVMLDKRNIEWIPKLEKAMKEKSSFIAVGSGHLGGENGVIKLLKKKGYKVKAIRV